MNKPGKTSIEYYDFNECVRYINNKYNINIRDYANKFKDGDYDDNTPYLDFWHWMLKYYDISNGCHINFVVDLSDDSLEEFGLEKDDWQVEIIKLFKSEFCEEGEDEINFYVWW